MNTNQLIRKFLARICEKNYSGAESLLQTVLVEKMKKRIKEKHKTVKNNKDTLSDEKQPDNK